MATTAATAAETLCRVNMEENTENMDEGDDFYIRDNSFICIGSIRNREDIFFLFKTLLCFRVVLLLVQSRKDVAQLLTTQDAK